jgi:hypothetical protein
MELLFVLLFAGVGFATGGIAITLLNWGRVRHAAAVARSAAHRELISLKESLESRDSELHTARLRLEQQGNDLAELVTRSQQAAEALAAAVAETSQWQQQVADNTERMGRLQEEIERWQHQAQREASARQAEGARREAAEHRSDLLEAQLSTESERYAKQYAELEGLRAKLTELVAPPALLRRSNGQGGNGHVLLLAAPEQREPAPPEPSGEAPEERPLTPEPARICLFCGSSRNVEDAQLEGRPDHASPENRMAACRACNNRFGMIFRRIGPGRRSRVHATLQAARSLGQWASALASVKGEGDGMPLAEAVGMIRATPADKRSRFSEELWGKRSNRR